MGRRLSCTGFQVGNVTIPPFECLDNELLGLVIPIPYGETWYEIQQFIAGVHQSPSVEMFTKAELVEPLRKEEFLSSVKEYIEEAGLSNKSIDNLMKNIGLKPDGLYHELQFTPKLLLDLQIAREQGAKLVIFSTAGLDPKGILTVINSLSHHLNQCSAINFISASLLSDHEAMGKYSRMIKCEALR